MSACIALLKTCFKTIFVLSLILTTQLYAQQSIEIKIPKLVNDRDKLVIDLLKLSLAKSAVTVKFIEANELVSEIRQQEQLISGDLDIIWNGMSVDLENKAQPIRVPIFKGILGHRIFVIQQGQQAQFDEINTLTDLQNFKAGSGKLWSDTKILQNANLPIVATLKGENLWPMLDGGRFDYFPLAIHEPWSYVRDRTDLDLSVEKHILLVYPNAMYFYVSNNPKLYQLIYDGMLASIKDGSYDHFLFNADMFKSALIAANVSERKVIKITNPFMHPKTPVDVAEYWLDPTKLSLTSFE